MRASGSPGSSSRRPRPAVGARQPAPATRHRGAWDEGRAPGDEAAAGSIVYQRTSDPADVVRAGLRGFDHDVMTTIPGLRTRLLAQGHRFLPRTVMARMTGKMLAPAEQHTTTDPKQAAPPPGQ